MSGLSLHSQSANRPMTHRPEDSDPLVPLRRQMSPGGGAVFRFTVPGVAESEASHGK